MAASEHDKNLFSNKFKICRCCEKEFYVPSPAEWTYKINQSSKGYVCSWKCLQEYRNKKKSVRRGA